MTEVLKGAGGWIGEDVCGWRCPSDGEGLTWLCSDSETTPWAALEGDFSFCLSNSALNSFASLDLRPTLLKGLTETEEEREEKLVLILSSVFSRRREPALWNPEESEPFSGIVKRWVGGVVKEEDETFLSVFGLELFCSCWIRRFEGSGGPAVCVKDWERFFLELSSKNSMTKACFASALPWMGRDWDSGGEEDRGSSDPGEVIEVLGELCNTYWDSDCRGSFALTGSDSPGDPFS